MQEKRHNESQEDYLEGIYVVNQRKGYCRSVDLAEELGYTKASVSVAVSKMKAENLLQVTHAGLLELTEEGKKIAEYTFQKHSLLKKMLCEIGVDEQQADIEACQIEHIISDETFQRLVVMEEGCSQCEKYKMQRFSDA
ncbi:MAG: metal-dependent transcriptional regulator [Lachnospiraceae bacterium]|nr:metal-dependent transcriptional regulator [Lachnospiraceae bacterium]